MHNIHPITLSLGALLLVATAGNACAQGTYQTTRLTEAEYRSGSREALDVQRWLVANAAYANGDVLGDFNRLGEISVLYKAVTSSVAGVVKTPGDSPPVPLPSFGNPGDTISITSTSGGISQTWSYAWQGSSTSGGWILTSYTYKVLGATEEP